MYKEIIQTNAYKFSEVIKKHQWFADKREDKLVWKVLRNSFMASTLGSNWVPTYIYFASLVDDPLIFVVRLFATIAYTCFHFLQNQWH